MSYEDNADVYRQADGLLRCLRLIDEGNEDAENIARRTGVSFQLVRALAVLRKQESEEWLF